MISGPPVIRDPRTGAQLRFQPPKGWGGGGGGQGPPRPKAPRPPLAKTPPVSSTNFMSHPAFQNLPMPARKVRLSRY